MIRTYHAARTWDPAAPFLRVDWCTILTAAEWLQWFRECLHSKINARDPRPMIPGPRWWGLEQDARVIREYEQGIRRFGCRNLLRSRALQARFPWINNQFCED